MNLISHNLIERNSLISSNPISIIARMFLIFLIFFSANCKIQSEEEGRDKLDEYFKDTILESKYIKSASILIRSPSLNFQFANAYERPGVESDESQLKPLDNPTLIPFHIASVGKIFTSVLILREIEKGKLDLDTKIISILGKDFLRELFVFEGVDYSNEVTIRQLLNHTSGLPDYFESFNSNEERMIDLIKKDRNRFWTPKDLLNYTRENQSAVGIPGKQFHYSDTGYILLGLLLEKLNGSSWEDQLKQEIFLPLNMQNTYVHLRSKPLVSNPYPLSTIMLDEADLTKADSVSADWAGGGIISTTNDLFLFQNALVSGKIIRLETYESMKGEYLFHDGIFYGLGLMTLDFGAMSFFMPKTAIFYGHSGILGTHLFYSPKLDMHIILNIGSSHDMESSFELLFYIVRILENISELKTSL
ncbi:serine hydrolase domain-containing protein [Leptospira sp. GIMC2001]|uniref:serine hydrolase domain-containing protein n=1 Tax=Leptospira sp. GIMC2001 TaxID=1513297 RepID=UPI00234AD934|nr:serine hydrolase [Leptospira sp. GIMC2001]WCL50858.1 serine hydrolase [Leptospira sp. GIMC2001]